jgi:hypothetical protein
MTDILKGGYLAGKKTYLIAALGVLSTIVAYLVGDLPLVDAAKLVFDGVLAVTIRAGIAKV